MTYTFWAIVVVGIVLWMTVIAGVSQISTAVLSRGEPSFDLKEILDSVESMMAEVRRSVGDDVTRQTDCVVASILATTLVETRTAEDALKAYRDMHMQLLTHGGDADQARYRFP